MKISPTDSPLELSVIVPVFCEHANIDPLLARLDKALAGITWEVIFIDDDSSDGTAALIRLRAQSDRRIRCIQRLGRRGLSSACVEGILASATPFFAIMDGDLQHDETLLPQMLSLLRQEKIDLAIGSRHAPGGESSEGFSFLRAWLSRIGSKIGRLVLKAEVSDPMSGYFMMRRTAFEAAMRQLSGIGFKILIDLFASSPRPLRFKELPYCFRARLHGTSKLDAKVAWEYVMLLGDKLVGHLIPVRLILFLLVGSSGIGVHLLSLKLGVAAGLDFRPAQICATALAILSNFAINNWFTYRDCRLQRWGLLRGFISFAIVCTIGAIGNVIISGDLADNGYPWWLAGITGATISALWNFALTSLLTWTPLPQSKVHSS